MKNWHYEDLKSGISLGLEGVTLFNSNRVKVIDTLNFGKALYIDGSLQLSEFDEHIYHEMLVHPLVSLTVCKRVLIIGGGDGGTLRELLKYEEIEHIDLVEINEQVIEVSEHYLPSLGLQYNKQHPKVSTWIGCGFKFLKNPAHGKYDAIFVDCGDVNAESEVLYTRDFIALCHERLNNDGMLNIQSQYYLGALNFIRELRTLCSCIFNQVSYYSCPIPTYPLGGIGFMLCSKYSEQRRPEVDIDIQCQFFDKTELVKSLYLPKCLRENKRETIIDEINSIGFHWKDYILGIDKLILQKFIELDGEDSNSKTQYPKGVFTIACESGRLYFKLRVMSDIGIDSINSAICRSLMVRDREELDGYKACGVEWDSRDNRSLSTFYFVDPIEQIGLIDPNIPPLFPERYYSKGLIECEDRGSLVAHLASPECICKVDCNALFDRYRHTSLVDIKKKLFKHNYEQVDQLVSSGLAPFAMSYVDFHNFELLLSF